VDTRTLLYGCEIGRGYYVVRNGEVTVANKKKTPQAKPKKKGSNLGYAEPKRKKVTKKAPAVKKGPRQQALPGIEDRAINSLEEKALRYAEVRDSRMALSKDEVTAKAEVMNEMKRLKKEHYKRNRIDITMVHEKENVKVVVKAETGDGEDDMDEEVDDREPQDVDVQVDIEEPVEA
jgi:hypothetical protein